MSNLVTNGCFSTGDFTGWSLFQTTLGTLSVVNSPIHPPCTFSAQGQVPVSTGPGSSSFRQTIADSLGTTYTVSFYYTIPAVGAGETAEIRVSLGATLVADIITTVPVGSFTLFSTVYTATASNETLNFALVFATSDRTTTYIIDDISVTPFVCVATNTEILMADRSKKLIQLIERGDEVAANLSVTKTHRVARLTSIEFSGDMTIDLCKFEPDTIAVGVPDKQFICTPTHPIIHNSKRYAAKLFDAIPGISSQNKVLVSNILPTESDNVYRLWDLQFETVGSYVANGLIIQSRHPQSFLTPLPRELYFNDDLYDDKLKNDHDAAFEFPLVYERVYLGCN
jgi:hypothetical protein